VSERFTIAAVGGVGQMIDLGDDSLSSPRTSILAPPLPALEFQLQTIMPARARLAKTIARGNVVTPYTWEVTRTHASVRAAIQFEKEHAKQIADACSLGQYVLARVSFNVRMRSVGALKSVRGTRHLGVKTWFEYTWQGTPFE
jgi:hypothetical protein